MDCASSGESQDTAPYLSVAIAAYNEAQRLPPALERALAFLETMSRPFEVVVCDDGSTDDTAAVVTRYASRGVKLLRADRNRGKGAALRAAVLASRGRYVLFSDADFSTPIDELPRLLEPLEHEQAEIAIGSRIQPDRSDMRATQPFYRRLFGGLFHLLVVSLVIRGIADTQAGFKAFTGDVARSLFAAIKLPSIVFDVELLHLAQKRGYRVVEVPVRWTNAGGSRMRVTPGHAVRVLWDVLRIRGLHRGQQPAPPRQPAANRCHQPGKAAGRS